MTRFAAKPPEVASLEMLERYPVKLFAFTLMQNHWHMVLRPSEDGLTGRMLRWVTATHTQRYHARDHASGVADLLEIRLGRQKLPGGQVWAICFAPAIARKSGRNDRKCRGDTQLRNHSCE